MARNIEITKGDNFLCIKDMYQKEDPTIKLFTKGENYEAVDTDTTKDDNGHHRMWMNKELFSKHFIKAKGKC